MTEARGRTLPQLDELNGFFWSSGRDGQLRFLRCGDCRFWLHPPSVVCPQCLNENLRPEPVSGLGTVAACTINYQPWAPDMVVPFAIAIVELDEQPALRLTTNIVGIPPEKISIGQRVRVTFEQQEDVWLPLFAPLAAS